MSTHKRVGRFELLEILGRGSFGTVWEARDLLLGRLAAVKLLDRGTMGDLSTQRFVREAQIAGNLQHPHIVKLLEIGTVDDETGEIQYLAYELIEGVTLAEWHGFTRAPHRETAELLAKLASAMHHAHENGVVHRDLKPENILMDLSGEPHITDFGLARRLEDRLTEPNVTLGTIAYMAPEQARADSQSMGPRADVFSLGVILFELLTGQLPFRGQSIPEYIQEASVREPTFPETASRQIPSDLATICLKCLASAPERRYVSAQALEQDLRRFIAGKPIEARPVSKVERLRRWAIRQPLAAALVGMLLLVSVISPMVAIQQARLRGRLSQTARHLREVNYGTDLYLAYQAWDEGRLYDVRKILARSVPQAGELDLRCFAWRYLHDRLSEVVHVAASTSAPIYDFAVTQNRHRLLTVGASRSLEIWHLATGNLERSLPLRNDSHSAVAVLGEMALAGTTRDGQAVVEAYDLESGLRKNSFHLNSTRMINSIRVSPDERFLVVSTRYGRIHVLDISGNELTSFANHDRNQNVAISPNGRFLAAPFNDRTMSIGRYGISLWDFEEQRLVQRKVLPNKVLALSWSPDSEQLAIQITMRNACQVFSVPDLENERVILTGEPAKNGVDFSQDGKFVVGGQRSGALFMAPAANAGDRDRGVGYTPHASEITALHFIGNQELLSASEDGTAVISRPFERQRNGLNELMAVEQDARLAYSQIQDQLFVGDRSGLLKNQLGQTIASFSQPINALSLLHGDQAIACGLHDGSISIVDLKNSTTGISLRPESSSDGYIAVNSIQGIGSDEWLVTGANDTMIRFWSIPLRKAVLEAALTDRIPAIAVDTTHKLAFACGPSEYIAAFDLKNKCEAYRLACGKATALAMDPRRNWLISGHRHGGISVWNLATRERMALLQGHTENVKSLAISPDGDILASSSGDGTVRFWSLSRLAEIGVAYRAEPDWYVTHLCFANDERSLLGILFAHGQNCRAIRLGGEPTNWAETELTGR